jgi:hypothetical protein
MSNSFFRRNSADQDKKLDTEVVVVEGLDVHRLRVQPLAPSYTLRLNDTGTGTVYVGEAPIGSAEGDSVWRIKKVLTVGSDMSILWADGNELFNKAWAGHAGLSYT